MKQTEDALCLYYLWCTILHSASKVFINTTQVFCRKNNYWHFCLFKTAKFRQLFHVHHLCWFYYIRHAWQLLEQMCYVSTMCWLKIIILSKSLACLCKSTQVFSKMNNYSFYQECGSMHRLWMMDMSPPLVSFILAHWVAIITIWSLYTHAHSSWLSSIMLQFHMPSNKGLISQNSRTHLHGYSQQSNWLSQLE